MLSTQTTAVGIALIAAIGATADLRIPTASLTSLQVNLIDRANFTTGAGRGILTSFSYIF